MLKKLIILIGLAVAGLALTSCFDDNVTTYDGPLQMEITPATVSLNNIQNNDPTVVVSVQLISPTGLQSVPHSGTIRFVADESTAVQSVGDNEGDFRYDIEFGTHFTLEGCEFSSANTCDFTIAPEDSLSKDFAFSFNLDNVETQTRNTVVFEIEDRDGAAYIVAPNLRRSEIVGTRGNN
ncbi:MAG: hypothetical protein LAT84_05070 [Balneolia bacterium]|nr:hypothetical protein [Balneolia bacterium]